MAKGSGLGQQLYVSGVDLSGDVGSLSRVGGGPTALEVTGINKSAPERLGGVRDGELAFNSWFNDAAAAEHTTLRGLPTTDIHVMHVFSPTVGGAASALVGKQINYDGTRSQDGGLAFTVQTLSNGFGIEMAGAGIDGMLTAGKRVDTTATNGSSIDYGAVSTLFGASAYLQVFALTGTNVILTVQDSADNVSFAAITGLTFTSVTAAPASERLQTATGATIRRYVRVASSGTFTSATFAVLFIRHLTATL